MTSHQPGVTYTLSAFKRARFVGGGKHLLLQADQADELALRALGEATFAVTEALRDYEARDEAYVFLDGPVPTPNGQAALVRDCEPAGALQLMLDHLAAELTARGITGKLAPVKTFRDDSLFGSKALPVLGMILSPLNETDAMYAAFEGWRHRQLARGSWVEEDRHRRVITGLMEWVAQRGGKVLIHTTSKMEANPDGLVDYLTTALRHRSRIGISATSADRRTRRQVRFAESEVIVYDYDPDQPRRDQLASLADLAARLAPDLAYALVRELHTAVSNLSPDLRHVAPSIELFRDLSYTGPIKHLEPDYVLDAGVAQVLTGGQLAKTNLSSDRWKVENLGQDRHLVTARDPEPWLHPNPQYIPPDHALPPDWIDPEALAIARADFGPAILTLDTLRQHPPPLTPDQIRTDPNLHNLGVMPAE